VDGSAPEPLGVFWLPAMAVGEGDEPGEEDGALVATEVGVAAGDDVAGADCAAEGNADGEDAARVVAAGGALCVADGFAGVGDGLGLA
jgi:hypothetical protein